MRNVGKIPKKINLPCPASYNEPMSLHTSFRIGGPADIFVTPRNTEELAAAYKLLNEQEVPAFILGAGANILVRRSAMPAPTHWITACRAWSSSIPCREA